MTNRFFRDLALRLIFSITVAVGLITSHAADGASAPQVIGSEALVTMPSDAISNRWINLRPGDGDVVNLNPPIFSWLYVPNPQMRASDIAMWQYQLQIGYDPGFGSPVVNVHTKCNFYNFLPPFNPGPVYWRVAYVDTNNVTNSWSPVHVFTNTANATVWDRSMLADTNYLLSKTHPRMIFNSNTLPLLQSNIAAVLALPASAQATNDLARVYNIVINNANAVLNQTWSFGMSNFNIDFWVQFNGVPSGSMALLSETADASDNWSIYLNSNSQLTMQFMAGGTTVAAYTMNGPWTISSGTWYHLAFERNGSSGIIFINGVSQTLNASATFGSNDAGEVYGPLLVGRCPGTADFNGWIDELRMDKICRWSSNFTPPSTAYNLSTYDLLLLTFDGTNSQTSILDISADSKLVTCCGNAQLSTAQQKFGTASVAFGGNGDYLLIRDYWHAPFSIPAVNGVWAPVNNQLPTLMNLSLAWRLTGSNQYLLGTNLTYAAGLLASDAVNAGYIDGSWDDLLGGLVEVLGMSYDWLYDVMPQDAQSNIVKAIELNCAFSLDLGQGVTSSQGYWADRSQMLGSNWNLIFTNLGMDYLGEGKEGLGHPWANANYAQEAAIAVYSESTNQALWDLFTIGMNYMIAKDYPFSDNTGSGINTGVSYAGDAMNRNIAKMLFFHSAFPEAGFNRNPIYTNLVAWFDWMLPVGFAQANWPWGDVGYGRTLDWVQPMELGRSICALTGSGTAFTHWKNQLKVYGNLVTPNTYNTLMIEANGLTNYPATPDASSTAQWFPEGGWVMGATYPPDSFQCFTNGVGFIFQARPRGTDFEHDDVSDLSFQMWAYGSVITDAADGQTMLGYAKVPIAHYSLLVNGIGEGQPLIQSNEFFNQVLAYETTSNYTYVVADGTASYPTNDITLAPGWLYTQLYYADEQNSPCIGLTKVRRHILFMRQQGYFIVYDDLADTNAVTYTWLYHILENTLTGPDTTTFSNCLTFSYTSDTQAYTGLNTNWPPVTVYVSHIANASQLSVTDMSGANVRNNPITGDNFSGPIYGSQPPWPSSAGAAGSGMRAHALWISNKIPATNFHFMTVIYPVRPGGAAPQITRLDDYTVAVTNGAQADVVSFDPNTQFPATLIVNAIGSSVASVQSLSPPSNLRITQ